MCWVGTSSGSGWSQHRPHRGPTAARPPMIWSAAVGSERGERVRYRFSPLEQRGVIAGWRGGQIASVTAGLVIGVLVLRWRPSVGGVALAVAGVAAGVALAFWPIAGRTGEEWLPVVSRLRDVPE